jgi:hypothetical protein
VRAMQIVIVVAASVLPLTAVAAGPGLARPVTSAEKRQAVAELAAMLRARYAIAETGEAAATAIEQKIATGVYDTIANAEQFAQAVKADLVAVTRDKHLNFGVAPQPEPVSAPGARPNPDAEAAAWRARARRRGRGVAVARHSRPP